MEEIYIDISKDLGCSVNVIQGDNNSKTYKLIVTDKNKRINLTNKSVKMAYVNNKGDGDIIEGLQITNAVQGEISLPITNILTRQDGNYGCQLAIYNSSGFLEHTGTFSLIVKENLFNRISSGLLKTTTYQKLISILEKSEEMVANLHDAREVNSSLSKNINSGTNLNTNLNNNIRGGNSLNAALTQNKQDAAVKNTELNKSLEETKKYITGLDGSQNIPQIRMDLDTLQNGLKANQSLEYQGSNITCNNTLEGRTEGMELRGRTLQNLNTKETYSFNSDPVNDGKYTIIEQKSNSVVIDIKQELSSWRYFACGTVNKSLFKPNTKYTIIGNFKNVNRISLQTGNAAHALTDANWITNNKAVLTTKDSLITIPDDATIVVYIFIDSSQSGETFAKDIMILEGDWTNKETPQHFEGIKSVGEAEINLLEESQIVDGYIGGNDGRTFTLGSNTSTAIIPCEPNTTYTIVKEKQTDRFTIGVSDLPINNRDKIIVIGGSETGLTKTVTTTSNARYLAVYLTKNTTNEPVGKVGIYKSVDSFEWRPANKAKISSLSIGKNLFNTKNLIVGDIDPQSGNTSLTAISHAISKDFIRIKPNTLYSLNYTLIIQSRWFSIFYYDINKKYISYNDKNIIFTSPNNCYYIKFKLENSKNVGIKDLMLNEGTQVPYEEYQSDKKEILLNQPLRGLSNICDKIYEKDGKVVLEQNIDKMNLSGNDDLTWLVKNDSSNTILFYIDGASMSNVFKKGSELMCNTFPKIIDTWGSDIEGINIDGYCSLQIRINKNKLATQDVNGFKKWLQANPVTVYYQRASPIITELNIKDLDLSVFQDVTHIMSTNSIPAEFKFKIASNIGSILQQQSKNINDLYKIIDEILVPQVTSNTLDIELLKNK
ncbi:BppU family phage baseplate upper protein [Clostridium sardiniense]|uniref:BppU family phage baseplate upper protein n=1 Tax=Clostridium sardiniense TaxID=29369 RepID=UPI00195AA6D5|nr:BppU family phage baseplate upper protein [Clostridium sardiniense]MBM7836448.1 hypothetical protein [Clostridium sardiniense]